MDTFQAFRIDNDDGTARAGIERIALADLSPGEVVIRTAWSSVNYKDALAGTGKGKILRGIGLLGVASAHCPMPLRRRIWERLATDLRPRALDSVVRSTIDLDGLPAAFEDVLAGKSVGRILVAIGQAAS